MKKIILCSFVALFSVSTWAQTPVSAVIDATGFVTIDNKWDIKIEVDGASDVNIYDIDHNEYFSKGVLVNQNTKIASGNTNDKIRIQSCSYTEVEKLVTCYFLIDKCTGKDMYGLIYNVGTELYTFSVTL